MVSWLNRTSFVFFLFFFPQFIFFLEGLILLPFQPLFFEDPYPDSNFSFGCDKDEPQFKSALLTPSPPPRFQTRFLPLLPSGFPLNTFATLSRSFPPPLRPLRHITLFSPPNFLPACPDLVSFFLLPLFFFFLPPPFPASFSHLTLF